MTLEKCRTNINASVFYCWRKQIKFMVGFARKSEATMLWVTTKARMTWGGGGAQAELAE